jgi:hypothetical protein
MVEQTIQQQKYHEEVVEVNAPNQTESKHARVEGKRTKAATEGQVT